MLIFDSHLDLAWNALEWGRDVLREVDEIRGLEKGLTGPGRGTNTVSLPELRRAQVGVFIATILARKLTAVGDPPFIAYPDTQAAYVAGRAQVECYERLTDAGYLKQISTGTQLSLQVKHCRDSTISWPLGYILSMEGADSIRAPEEIPDWWDCGLRIIGPVHYGSNQYGHGTSTTGGFSSRGLALLDAMEDQGMILDITHLTDQGFWEAMDHFSGPVLASHHNCRALVPGERQLSDDQIRVLIERGAVIGVACDAWMLSPNWVRGVSEPSKLAMEAVVDHIDHICQLAGNTDHVGIGSDLDGGFGTEQCPHDLNTISDLQRLVPLLEGRGFDGKQIQSVMHGNWISFFEGIWNEG
jgi:membrane dipeptidase